MFAIDGTGTDEKNTRLVGEFETGFVQVERGEKIIVPDGEGVGSLVTSADVASRMIDLLRIQLPNQGDGSFGIRQIELVMKVQCLGCTAISAMNFALWIAGKMTKEMLAEIATSASDKDALLGHDWNAIERVGQFIRVGMHSMPYMVYPLS